MQTEMRETLTYLERTATDELEEQLDGKVPAWAQAKIATKQSQVYGFVCAEETTRRQATAEFLARRRQEINSYQRSAHELRAALAVQDIEPLCVITCKAWDAILRQSGLHVLWPDSDGKITRGTALAQSMRGISERRRTLWMFLALALSSILLGGIIAHFGTDNPTGWLVGVFAGCALMFASGFLLDVLGKRGRRWAIKRYIANHTWEQFLRDTDPAHGDAVKCRVAFPDPPPPVQQMLQRFLKLRPTHAFPLGVAAEAGAITFKDDYFKTAFAAIEEFERAERLARDPILFTVHGTAVAVLGQYGDFALEHAVIDQVINSEHLL